MPSPPPPPRASALAVQAELCPAWRQVVAALERARLIAPTGDGASAAGTADGLSPMEAAVSTAAMALSSVFNPVASPMAAYSDAPVAVPVGHVPVAVPVAVPVPPFNSAPLAVPASAVWPVPAPLAGPAATAAALAASRVPNPLLRQPAPSAPPPPAAVPPATARGPFAQLRQAVGGAMRRLGSESVSRGGHSYAPVPTDHVVADAAVVHISAAGSDVEEGTDEARLLPQAWRVAAAATAPSDAADLAPDGVGDPIRRSTSSMGSAAAVALHDALADLSDVQAAGRRGAEMELPVRASSIAISGSGPLLFHPATAQPTAPPSAASAARGVPGVAAGDPRPLSVARSPLPAPAPTATSEPAASTAPGTPAAPFLQRAPAPLPDLPAVPTTVVTPAAPAPATTRDAGGSALLTA
jgi:hypothetical protein